MHRFLDWHVALFALGSGFVLKTMADMPFLAGASLGLFGYCLLPLLSRADRMAGMVFGGPMTALMFSLERSAHRGKINLEDFSALREAFEVKFGGNSFSETARLKALIEAMQQHQRRYARGTSPLNAGYLKRGLSALCARKGHNVDLFQTRFDTAVRHIRTGEQLKPVKRRTVTSRLFSRERDINFSRD